MNDIMYRLHRQSQQRMLDVKGVGIHLNVFS